MDGPIVFSDGAIGSPPIVIPRELFAKIQRLAAQANMEPTQLIQLALADVFNDPNMTLEILANIIRQLPDQM